MQWPWQVDAEPLQRQSSVAELSRRQEWLIRLRWFAIVGTVSAVTVGAWMDWLEHPRHLFAVTAIMALVNLFFQRSSTFRTAMPTEEQPGAEAFDLSIQVIFDLCSLTLLLHWSGGIENPFAMFFVFHMALSAILFPLRRALMLCGLAVLLFAATTIAEGMGLILHSHLLFGGIHSGADAVSRDPLYLATYLAAFALTMFGTVGFVHTVEQQRRQARHEARERERIAVSRERLARIGELSANVAHTVRNPLHGALNCVDLLRGGPAGKDADSQETLDLLGEALQRIEAVTARLLHFTADRPVEIEPTDLNRLLEDSLPFVDKRPARVAVLIHTSLGQLPLIPLDRERIAETVINLLDNSVFACRDGGTVTLSTAINPRNPNSVTLTVTDTGEGIAAADLPHLFDPFFTTKSAGKGSGLGLAIAQRVVEEHGGAIDLQSTLGAGTEIRILLPLQGQLAAR